MPDGEWIQSSSGLQKLNSRENICQLFYFKEFFYQIVGNIFFFFLKIKIGSCFTELLEMLLVYSFAFACHISMHSRLN
jgi:hypothetical protein